jgi:hypothetical protein
MRRHGITPRARVRRNALDLLLVDSYLIVVKVLATAL